MTESSPSLTPLQRELIDAFFEREETFVLTGGAALAGFYLRHRPTKDVDLFGVPGSDIDRAEEALASAADSIGAKLVKRRDTAQFRRFKVERGDEITIVDMVIDRAAQVASPVAFGRVRVHTLREIAANKLCTVLSRSEPRDLVDLMLVLRTGIDLDQALRDARLKDGGMNPAALAWVLGEIRIGEEAVLPGGVSAVEVEEFRRDLERRLRAQAVPPEPQSE